MFSRMNARRISLFLAVLTTGSAAAAMPASALAQGDGLCLVAEPPPAATPPQRLRFGITPELAGTVGAGQAAVAPEDDAKRDAALAALVPPRRALVIRLNRLFMSDGAAGIRRFVRLARAYERDGFLVESQVRYHPTTEQEGDLDAWGEFVALAARKLGNVDSLVALSITNEVNLPLSANTSDGAYERADEAIVTGIEQADRTLRQIGRRDVELGFTYAWRYLPNADVNFWRGIGELGDERFRRAIDHVGIQLYPGLFWPPVLLTETAGEATLEALTILRDCYMPLAGLGPGKEIWVSENGYATNLGHNDARQAAELTDTLDRLAGHAGTLGVSDYRYFNLRDNEPSGTDLFDNVGLLRSDYTQKPAFAAFRDGLREHGTRVR